MIIPNETGTKTGWCSACSPGNLPEVFRDEKFDPFDEELYPLGFPSDPELLLKIFDFSEPTRVIFWSARDRRPKAINPLTSLVRELIRRGMRCPTDVRVMGKPLSTFVAVVARSGTGKSESLQEDALVWPKLAAPKWLEDKASRTITPKGAPGGGKSATNPPAANVIATPGQQPILIPFDFDDNRSLGSGQVLADKFLITTGRGEGEVSQMKPHPVLWVLEDELSQMLDASKADSNTLVPAFTAAWSGLPIGNDTRQHGDRRVTGNYNLFMLGGIQPKLAHKLLPHVDSGFFQRFVLIPATDPYYLIGEPTEVSRPINPAAPMPHIREGDQFTVDPKITAELEIGLVASYFDHLPNEEDEDRSQHNMVRLRIAALGALLHGTLTISYELWLWAGWIMELSRRVEAWMRVEIERSAARVARAKGKEQAYVKASAASIEDDTKMHVAEKFMAKLASAGASGHSAGELLPTLSDNQKDFRFPALKYLTDTAKTVVLVGKRYYLVGFAPGTAAQTTPTTAPGGGIATPSGGITTPGQAAAPAPGTEAQAPAPTAEAPEPAPTDVAPAPPKGRNPATDNPYLRRKEAK
jgi:hypothetical protein